MNRTRPPIALATILLMSGMAARAPADEGVTRPATGPATNPTTAPMSGPSTGEDAFPGDDGPATTGPSGGVRSPELELFKDIPVVVAAGMRAQTGQQAAASVSIVNANDIELFNYRSLADVLHGQRSFYLDSDGLNWFAGVRGFQRPGEWNSRILVLEDGMPTNELIYGQAHLDQDFALPMEALKQVEIVRGPGSSLYGSGAVFGVLNEVTKDGADVHGIQIKAEAGTGSTGHFNLLAGEKFKNGLDVVGDLTGFTSQGNNDLIYDGITDRGHNDGHIPDADYEGVYSGFIKLKLGDATLEADTAARRKDDAAATGVTSFFHPGDMYERRDSVDFRINHTFDDGGNLQAKVYYGHYHYQQGFPYDSNEVPVAYTYFSAGEDDWIGEQVHYGRQLNDQNHLLVGADGTQAIDTDQHDENSRTGPVLNIPASFNSFGLFAEDEYKPWSWLSITTGIRVDRVQRVGTTVSPRFAAIWNPTRDDTFKLLYGRAFRDPNLYELLYTSPPPDGTFGNPRLKPEIVDTYELIYERKYGGGWSSTLNGYIWKMSNSMENYSYPDGALQIRNSGTLWANGVEAEIDKRWENGGSWRTYASYSQAEEDNQSLAHSPNWIVGSSVALPLWPKSFLSFEPQIVAPMKSDLMQYTHPTFITNVVFTSRDLFGGWTLQAGVYNLFASRARFPRDGSFNQTEATIDYPSTTFLVSLSKKF